MKHPKPEDGNIVAKHFCALPFTQFSTFNHGRHRLCCMAQEPEVDNPTDDLETVWNGDYMKNVRKRMHDGEALKECRDCYDLERQGIMSDRQWENIQNKDIVEKEIETWKQNNYNIEAPIIYDLRLGNRCNLQCSMCSGIHSHLVHVERSKMVAGGKGFFKGHRPYVYGEALTGQTYSKKEALLASSVDWDYILNNTALVKQIKLIGGEPTISEDLFTLMDACVERDHAKNIELQFFTNATNFTDSFLDNLTKFKGTKITTSIDGWGEMNDYIRYPSKWDHLWENFTKLVDVSSKHKKVKVRLSTVSQITNMWHMTEFYKKLFEFQESTPVRIGLSSNQLVDPAYYNVRYAPEFMKEHARGTLRGFLNNIKGSYWYEETFKEPVEDIIKWMEPENHIEDKEVLTKHIHVTEDYDTFRKVNVRTVFPGYDYIKSYIGL
ncbi:MAG: twitch domain-containing radical SAM protein [Bacteroidetes bacterium]|nr:twitch domain-containing radical SAM protein [Bacteroidota bacterium]